MTKYQDQGVGEGPEETKEENHYDDLRLRDEKLDDEEDDDP